MSPQAVWENFRDAVANHYFDFKGRVSRAQFWYFVLALLIAGFAAGMLSVLTYLPLNALLGLALLPPFAGLGARRLQDTGRKGSFVWLLVVPSAFFQLIGLFTLATGPAGFASFLVFFYSVGWALDLFIFAAGALLIYYWVQPGDAGTNAYGPAPGAITILPPV